MDIPTVEPPAAETAPQLTPAQRKRVILGMCLALALVVSAVASLNIALPSLAADIGASQTEQQWIIDAYALVFAGLLLFAGAIGDKYGRKYTLLVGLTIFGAAYAFGAFVDEPSLLIGARAVAGIGAALVMPSTLSIITTAFPPEERAKAVGTWAGVAGGGAVMGLLLSGTLLEVSDWQWVFGANAIWATIALIAGVAWVPHSRDAHQPPLDFVGAVLSAGGLGAAIFSTIEGPERGWSDGLVIGGFTLGAILLTGFVLWELRRAEPMLDPRLFRRRGFRTGSTSLTLQFFASFGFFFASLQYLQLVRGYSPLEAAIALIPMALTVIALSRAAAPRLVARFGHRVVDAAGLLVLAGGFGLLATLDTNSSYLHFLLGLVPLAAGMGLATTPATASIVESLPASKQGVASAVNDTSREVGGAVGIAVLGSLLNAGYRNGVEDHLDSLPPEAAEQAHDSLAFVVNAAPNFGEQGREIVTAAQSAFVDGFNTTMVVGATILIAGALIVFGRGKRSDQAAADALDADGEAHRLDGNDRVPADANHASDTAVRRRVIATTVDDDGGVTPT